MVNRDCAVAVIGFAGRFPGAPDVDAFWRNVLGGVESIRTFSPDEMEDAFGDAERSRPEYVRARGIVEDPDLFDAEHFGIVRHDAERMDPQHRLFLEACSDALDNAGYQSQTYPGRIGVYAGASINTYLLKHVLGGSREAVDRFTADFPVASYPELLGAGADFLTTRVAYKLNLRGPAMTVQAACSTSLLAIAQAAQTLMLGQADMMLAGGVSISFPQKRGYLHQSGGMVSADGHCRTFDAQASGTVFGDGVGVVVLKRLEDALADGDTIAAVIRGYGITNDAAQKAGFTAPSVEGQAAAVAAAHAMAGFAPESVGYIECHGTATPLGDPIEIEALARVFAAADGRTERIALGSVKPNVGHLDVAAGVTGFLKAALTVRDATIAPTRNFTKLNPEIDFGRAPFAIAAERAPWNDDVRRAGVSAFGVGGTNVHIALESAPPRAPRKAAPRPQLFVLSARSAAALGQARERLIARLRELDDADAADAAYTLAVGRRAYPYRASIVATTIAEAIQKLEALALPNAPLKTKPVIGFMFPGQGAQYAGMGSQLYAQLPVFTAAIDRCADLLAPELGADLRDVLFPATIDDTAHAALRRTEFAQVALFALEYALACVWQSWGIAPAAMIGHSVGEFVAAVLAGVFSLDDALALVRERGRLMGDLAPGSMLAVRLGAADLTPLLPPGIDLAAINAPALCVVAGPTEAIDAFAADLDARGIAARRLHTSHAFHSAMMDPVVEPLTARASAVALAAPAIPYVSGVSGDWIDASATMSPAYWARHCREPVRFAPGLQTLIDGGVTALVEIGPGAALSTFARQGAGREASVVVRSLPTNERETSDLDVMLEAAGKLWAAGAPLDLAALFAHAPHGRIPMPSYPFERKRYWMEPIASPRETVEQRSTPQNPTAAAAADAHVANLTRDLVTLFEEVSGENLAGADPRVTFLELGFDSLFLGRIVQHIQTRFGVAVTFRELLDAIPSIDALAARIALDVPPPAAAPAPVALPSAPVAAPAFAAPLPSAPVAAGGSGSIEALMRDQLAAMQGLMRDQLVALSGLGLSAPVAATSVVPAAAPVAPPQAASSPVAVPVPVDAAPEPPSRFEAFKITPTGPKAELTPAQAAHIDALVARTVARTPRSKERTALHRPLLADPRVAAGFRTEWKEMVYPITCVRAHGSRQWDIDGNEYIDILNGFGQTAFGHSPDFVVDAVKAQLADGFAIGPMTDLAGQVAELFCELTGNERVTFCNTGSEAVMAAIRVARAVTGRSKIVMFDGSYHGQFDEVLVKSARRSTNSLPVASGIPNESVSNITVLEYGSDATLAWIREHARELAAVLVEPVQSRHPGLVPLAFLRELREITANAGTALVFDEVVTGFRVHPGGLQAIFGIRADLATYGKVAGGGMPIGILAGSARYMDALDGGTWSYGDDSVPQVAPTFFAGTFVRHPLTMAAVLAVLRYLKAEGPALQAAMTARTERLVAGLNDVLAARGIATRIESYGSMFYLNLAREERFVGLLYYHMRNRGIYVQEGFPCFLTSAHTDADVAAVIAAFDASLGEMQADGFFGGTPAPRPLPPPAPREPREFALTESQTEIWLAAQMSDEASCAFNESVTVTLRGALDRAALERAWTQIIARHESLRASFSPTGERMIVPVERTIPLGFFDASADAGAARGQLAERIARDARTPFDLVAGPLVRAELIRLAPDEHALVLTAHHIVCDGWSTNVIVDELAAVYAAATQGTDAGLAAPLAFSEYAARLAQRDPAARTAVERYWLEQFREPVQPLDLPGDRPRPAIKTFAGGTRSAAIDRETTARIRAAGARLGCTLFVTLLTGFHALVGRLAERRDVVVGVPTAGQSALDGEILVGHCVNFLPVRAQWERATTGAELLAAMKRRVLDAYEHQDYTLGTLVRALSPERGLDRVPLAEVQFNLERLAGGTELPGVTLRIEPNAKAFVNFDLFLNVVESSDGLRLDCDYSADLFDAATIDRWLACYEALLRSLAADPSAAIAALDYLPKADRRLLDALNATAAPYPHEQSVHGLVEVQAALHPDAVAVRFGDRTLTYEALDSRANRLANLVLKRSGGARKLVGVLVERSDEMVVALLATLKAGCAYVPLDPTHPPARLQRILAEADIAVLITDDPRHAALVSNPRKIIDIVRDAATIAAEAASTPPAIVAPDDLAYVIYTSGSTGAPKGVEVAHRNVVNFLTTMARTPGLRAVDTLLAVTTIAFDIAGLELFLPLSVGASVIIASNEDTSDGFRLLELTKRATVMQATPATWRLLLEGGFAGSPALKMLCGGEALPRELADRLLVGGGELWNMYGPTETTIWSSCVRVTPGSEPITVGTPIANTTFFVLDGADRPVPPGVPGHLHIGGDGVARGYFKRPELTADRFIPNPFGAGRLYRTGDIARVLPNGRVQVVGRSDHQVKLRGYRIELGEIEAVLEKNGKLAAAAVTMREDEPGDAKLVAYYVCRPGVPQTAASLRAAIADDLPRYMLPSAWVELPTLPLSPAGKIDRAALPPPGEVAAPVPAAESFDAAASGALSPTEEALARIWSEVLRKERVSTTDTLFALGADSLQIFAITARANAAGIKVAAKELFRYPTIEALAKRIDEIGAPSMVTS